MVLKVSPHYLLLTFYAYMLLHSLVVCAHCAEILQTLYFTNDTLDLGLGSPVYLLNGSSIISGPPSESTEAFFASQPLAAYHRFTNLTITINHTSVVSVDSRINIVVGSWVSSLNQYIPYHEDYHIVEAESTWVSFSFATQCSHCGINVQEQDRLWIHLSCEGEGLNLIWGNMSYNGRVSFDGVAEFVPEFSSAILLAFFIAISLILIVHRRKTGRRLFHNHS